MDDGSDAVTPDGADANPENGAFDPAPAVSAAVSPATVGARLKAAREAQGLTTKDVALRTRITLRHIEALETGAYDTLPGRPYALGFARAYARAVGLDGKDVTEAVRRELDGSAPRPEPRVIHQFEVGDPAKTPSRLVSWLAFALFLGVIGMGLVFWRSYYWPAAELPALVGPEEATTAAAVAPKPAVAAPVPAGPVVFTALEDAIWVKFSDGTGKQLLQKQLAKGESWTIPTDATEPRLWTGRPDALAITIGGQAVPRIADKEGIVKDVPVSAAALLARGQAVPAPAPAAVAPVTGAPAAANSTSRRVAQRRPAQPLPPQSVPAAAPQSPESVPSSTVGQ